MGFGADIRVLQVEGVGDIMPGRTAVLTGLNLPGVASGVGYVCVDWYGGDYHGAEPKIFLSRLKLREEEDGASSCVGG